MEIRIGENIKYLRKKMGLTTITLGEKMGKRDSTVSQWETGKGYPTFSALVELRQLLDTDLERLVFVDMEEADKQEAVKEAEKPKYFSIHELVGEQAAKLKIYEKALDELIGMLNEVIAKVSEALPKEVAEAIKTGYMEKISDIDGALRELEEN